MISLLPNKKQNPQRSNVVDVDCEIKNPIVFNCHFDLLQRKALRDDLDIQNLVATAREIKSSNKQEPLVEEKRPRKSLSLTKTR